MPKWTTMQQAAIDKRNANILVSAAAGSGKTAVLTQRVVNRILGDESGRIEIDRFLIVTFTIAAAGEMKERISAKLDERRQELIKATRINQQIDDSLSGNVLLEDNELLNSEILEKDCIYNQDIEEELDYIDGQIAKVPRASISTIHSFCLKTIKSYFNKLDIDPNIKVGNDADLIIMKSDILDELFEDLLEERNPEFLMLADVYGDLGGFIALKDIILNVYTFSKSTIFPNKWLDAQVQKYNEKYNSVDDIAWSKAIKEHIKGTLEEIINLYNIGLELCKNEDGPETYVDLFATEIVLMKEIEQLESLNDMANAINNFKFGALSRKKVECDEKTKADVQEIRKTVKKAFEGLQKETQYISDDVLLKQLPHIGKVVQAMVDIIKLFEERFSEEKKNQGIVDYNDLEQLCLKLLITPVELSKPEIIEATTESDKLGSTEEQTSVEMAEPGVIEFTSDMIDGEIEEAEEDVHEQVLYAEDLDSYEVTDDGEYAYVYTDVAKELSEFYKEVYIDEYQDSNIVQETILKAVSHASPNSDATRFMVGDMKQSIYRFRLANPYIFAKKYDSWDKHQAEEEMLEIKEELVVEDALDKHADSNDEVLDKEFRKIEDVCIDLNQNFRSRANVLAGVNDIFDQIMTKEVGELEYDEAARLNIGNKYDGELLEGEQIADAIELHVVETDSKKADDDINEDANKDKKSNKKSSSSKDSDSSDDVLDELEELKNAELEANMAAEIIDRILKGEANPTVVWDNDLGSYRRVMPKDIVILLRALSGKAEVYEKALINRGISTYADVANNFFETPEIQTAICMLRIIDNPLQDIPLISILRSPIISCSLDDLVYIRKSKEDGYFYEALKEILEKTDEEIDELGLSDCVHKLKKFNEMLDDFREKCSMVSLEELISYVYEETGFVRYISTLPAGVKKKANLELLKKYAEKYEAEHNKRLFGFMQYLEKLSKTPGGLPEAKVVGEDENLVRIMSIHKSKGLEFGVVLLCDTNKKFNEMDIRNEVLLHNELGIAPSYIDTEKYVRYPSLAKIAIKNKTRLENISEEMRVLYVALTRAKEKLIITAVTKDLEKDINKWKLDTIRDNKYIMKLAIKNRNTYYNWIGLSLYNKRNFPDFREVVGDRPNYLYDGESNWSIKRWSKDEILNIKTQNEEELEEKRELLFNWDTKQEYTELKDQIFNMLEYKYEHEVAIHLPTKVSVSELKKNAYESQDDPVIDTIIEQVAEPIGIVDITNDLTEIIPEVEEEELAAPVPKFMQEEMIESGNAAALRGTIIHSAFEHINYLKYTTAEEIQRELDRLIAEKVIDKQAKELVSAKKIAKLATSLIADKMRKADIFEKEKAFTYVATANEVKPEYPEDETILVQGIIDCYFVKDGKITIVDYKTDKVNQRDMEGSIEKIKKRYKIQLDFYAKAVEAITGQEVEARYLYLYNIDRWVKI